MHRHEHFDLLLHDDAELGNLLGAPVTEREPVTAWPLSAVERLRLADGRDLVYKAQAAPSLEPEIYAALQADDPSPTEVGALLPAARTLYRTERHACMVLARLDQPRLDSRQPDPALCRSIWREVRTALDSRQAELPVLTELAPAGWPDWCAALLADLAHLEREGRFIRAGEQAREQIAGAMDAPELHGALGGRVDVIHADLRTDNVFLAGMPQSSHTLRVIDWQFPRRGPVLLDLAALLESAGHDPVRYVGAGVTMLLHLQRIHWVVACARRWYPDGVASYDEQVYTLAGHLAALQRQGT